MVFNWPLMAGTCVNPVLRICCPWIHTPAVFPWCLTLAIDGKNGCESCSVNLLSLNTQTSCLPMVFNFGHWQQETGVNLLSLNTHTSCLPMVFNFGHWWQETGVNLLSLNIHTSCLPMVFNFGHWRQETGVNLLSLNTHTSCLPMVFNFGHWWQKMGVNPVQWIFCPWIHTPDVFPWFLTLATDSWKLVWILFSESAVPEYTNQQSSHGV